MHVKCKNIKMTDFIFKIGTKTVEFCKEYKYLGLMLNEFLDFQMMADAKYDAASRALSSIITKMKKNNGFPLKMYKTLYETCVLSVLLYGAGATWGYKIYN